MLNNMKIKALTGQISAILPFGEGKNLVFAMCGFLIILFYILILYLCPPNISQLSQIEQLITSEPFCTQRKRTIEGFFYIKAENCAKNSSLPVESYHHNTTSQEQDNEDHYLVLHTVDCQPHYQHCNSWDMLCRFTK